MFEVTEAVAMPARSPDELAALHLDLSAAMKQEVEHLHRTEPAGMPA